MLMRAYRNGRIKCLPPRVVDFRTFLDEFGAHSPGALEELRKRVSNASRQVEKRER